MTERMSERVFPTIGKQTLFLSILEELKHNQTFRPPPVMTEDVPHGSEQGNDIFIISSLPKFPRLLQTALQTNDVQLKSLKKSKIRTMLMQVLYDHLSQLTIYPSHKQYVELLSALVTNFPFLREKTGSGYDALLESLKNKFKKERLPLVNCEEIVKMKQRFGVVGSGRKRKEVCGEVTIAKTCRPQVVYEQTDVGEDERSIAAHIATMSVECDKARQNMALLAEMMTKTFVYRQKFILENTTAEVLKTFPCLRIPRLLFGDMKRKFSIDADALILTNLDRMASNIVSRSSASKLKDQCTQALADCICEKEKKGLQLSAAILLLPSLFQEDNSFLFVTEKIPDIPTPVISIHSCEENNPLKGSRHALHMDGQTVLNEDRSTDISLALGALFSLYYVFGVEYPPQLKKTLLFLERFVFKLNCTKSIPVTIKRVFSSVFE